MSRVNAALMKANSLLSNDDTHQAHLWNSGRGEITSGRPDWSFCSPSRRHPSGRYANMAPGDTKLSKKKKWHPSLQGENQSEWALPLRQVQAYSHRVGVRYGFLITDAHLVVLRFSRYEIGPGIGKDRSRRPLAIRQAVPPINGTTTSATSGGESIYSNSKPTNSYQPPQYCLIP